MAKDQKRGNREAKTPKQPKAKPIVAASPVAMAQAQAASPSAKKG